MLTATICEMYGWTWQEYQDQPVHFLDVIKGKLVRDNKEREREIKRLKRHG